MKKWEVGPCEFCGKEFMATNSGMKYCCFSCRMESKKKKTLEHHKKEYKSLHSQKKPKKAVKPKWSIAEVIRFCNAYEERTGKYLPYGKAVAMMDGRI